MSSLVLWRHSATGFNRERRLQGSLDVPLGDEGRAQARDAARLLVDQYGTDVDIVSSPLQRAVSSARELAALTQQDLTVDQAFTQRSYGEWEGLTHDEVAAGWPEQYAARQRGEDPAIEGWGLAADVSARVKRGLEELADRSRTVVVVSHGSAIQLGLFGLLELPLQSRILGRLPHAAWSEVMRVESGAWHLVAHGRGAV
ncbi:histidine phosphatase family protein [Demequina sediminicola]|uniref:histidine phosphatase family protein n=1 Tax=Demequina sediminicola TaxID=1095026 RepID=UPI0007808D37|nr:histidine phosphatase family protein [Demequina sediminicola]